MISAIGYGLISTLCTFVIVSLTLISRGQLCSLNFYTFVGKKQGQFCKKQAIFRHRAYPIHVYTFTQITVGGIIMLKNIDAELPEDLIEPLKGKYTHPTLHVHIAFTETLSLRTRVFQEYVLRDSFIL